METVNDLQTSIISPHSFLLVVGTATVLPQAVLTEAVPFAGKESFPWPTGGHELCWQGRHSHHCTALLLWILQ